jgi:GTPase Era involved in 16S rRNA processing
MAAILRHISWMATPAIGRTEMMHTPVPTFAVVGHPNKGKSSIVATLAQDDSVAISSESGTTRLTQSLDVAVGSSHYTLVDTPGFQRPTRVLNWLQKHATTAEKRQQAVAKFVTDKACKKNFPDEVQLLTPIMNGAAILYVVDGSRPYGPEYEAEMEILRWTGQASMALINPIENQDHVPSWQQALGQYFKVVRVFNAMQADFEKQLSVLEAFSIIKQEWQETLAILIQEYHQIRIKQQEESRQLLATLLIRLCSYRVSQKVMTKSQAQAMQASLKSQFFADMRSIESQCHDSLKKIYHYHNLESEIYSLPLEDNLFDTERWIVWGLNRKRLATAAGMAGAATGAAVDLSLAGHSLMLGAVGGGLVAGGSAWFGANRLADFKIRGLPIGGFEARQGPIASRNFPYVVLGRYLYLENALRNRTHARRDSIQINEADLSDRIAGLSSIQQRELHSSMDRLRRQKPVEALEAILKPLNG